MDNNSKESKQSFFQKFKNDKNDFALKTESDSGILIKKNQQYT